MVGWLALSGVRESHMSTREGQVLRLLADGMSVAGIAK
jgi:hypothetical protein